MKLRFIVENNLKHSKHAVRDTANILGTLIEYLYSSKHHDELRSLNKFLTKATPEAWVETHWIIDSLVKKLANDQELKANCEEWLKLKSISPSLMASAIYDVDPKFVKGTPLQGVNLSQQVRSKAKAALGPQGYLGALSNSGDLSQNKIKDFLRTAAQNSSTTTNAVKSDLSGVKLVKDF